MRSSILAALSLTIFLFGLVACVEAQIPSDDPWLDDVPCKNDLKKTKGLYLNHPFMFCFEYEEKELCPDPNGQVRPADLIITSYVPRGEGNIDSLQVQIDQDADHPGVSIEKLFSVEPIEGAHHRVSEKRYPFRLKIASSAKPSFYYVRMSVTYQGKIAELYFKLPLGAPAGDWLDIDNRQTALSCWTGRNCSPIKLSLVNKLPYEVEVTSVSIASDPDDLMEDNPADFRSQKITTGIQSQPLNLTVRAKPMSLSRVFSGFGKSPHLLLIMNYRDQYGREFSAKPKVLSLEMKPNLIVLIITVLLGVAIGTVIRIDLRRLVKAGFITKKQRLIFTGTTVATGVVVSLIALFTNLKMVVFEDQSTYSTWDPRMLFLTGLVGTIGGIPILYALLKLPKSPDANPKGPDQDQAPSA